MVNLKLKKQILEIVDNQLRDINPPDTKQVYQKLLDAGYSVDEAKEKIGAIVVEEIYNVMKEGQVYNEKRYIQALEEMLQQSLDYEDTLRNHTEWDEWDCLVEQGYQAVEEEKIDEMLNYWGKAWEIFQKVMEQEDEKKSLEGLMEELDYQYPIDEWLQDYEMELGNANQHEKRIEFCNTILEIFDWSYDDNSDFLASIGESLYAQGKVEEGRAWFEDWLKMEPGNDFAWVVLSGCIQKQEGAEQAYQLIRKKVINLPCTIKNHLLFERAKVLAHQLHLKKDLKWIDTQLNSCLESIEEAEYYNDLNDDFRLPVQQPLVKEKRVYPNDPCPCGSGKKYKKCCGRN